MSRKGAPGLPSRADILRFVAESPNKVGKREIARAFGITGGDRIALKRLLRELAEEGLLERGADKRLASPERLPEIASVEIVDLDVDGELLARPVGWHPETPAPRIVLAPAGRRAEPLAPGDRALVKLRRVEDGYEARVVRKLDAAPDAVVGVYSLVAGKGRVAPADKRDRKEYLVERRDDGGAEPGEIVVAEILPGRRTFGLARVRIKERLGDARSPRAFSLIALKAHGIPFEFPKAVEAEAAAAKPATLSGREDLRSVPLITIDGADARDFDDAVYAEPDGEGHRVLVAIADVAHYVRAGSALDREARRRGNSVYFPDRAIPMLPEALSNGLCSLKPREDRAVLAVELRIDREGRLVGHKFRRGLMRSAARLTYEQVQAAKDGRPDDATGPLMERVILPLYAAHDALLRARAARGTLEIEAAERQVLLDMEGRVVEIRPRPRLMSHRLIEDMMIAANVAAAEALEARRTPCMYRVHDRPPDDKVEALRDFLKTIDIPLAKGQVLRPAIFNRILAEAAGTPHARIVNEVVLRSQAQAVYSPDNLGHFGLALRRYAHFTSPIRRYSDLLVHRGLIGAFGFGPESLGAEEAAAFADTAEHISTTERRAASAERDAVDRFVAAHMADRVGGRFEATISGATRFGLFVRLDGIGADGLVPISTLGDDFYRHDERRHALVGARHGRVFRLGDAVSVKLVEATPVTGGLRFEIAAAPDEDARPGPRRGFDRFRKRRR